MDPPPHKRPRMRLLPQPVPQFGLNNLGALGVFPRFPILNLDHLSALQLALFLPSRLAQTVLPIRATVPNKKPIAAVPQSCSVSSTQQVVRVDKPAKVESVSPTRQDQTADDEGLTITLSKAAYNYISKSDGVYFRNLIAQHLHVVAILDNSTCKLKGPSDNLEKAKNAIQNFCDQYIGLKRLKKRTLIPIFDRKFTGFTTVQKNLYSLSSTDSFWLYKEIILHEQIAYIIDAIKDCAECEYESCEERLKESYATLNTILIVKLQNEEAERHMTTLRQFLDRDFDEVKQSFNYVFNSDRRIFPDYDESLTQLANALTDEFNNPQNLEGLQRKICRICKMFDWADDGRKMFCRYARILINNYQSEDINIFRVEFQKIFQRHILQIRKHGKIFHKKCPSTE